MDRYERLIRDVLQKTGDEILRWQVASLDDLSRVILNADRVIRVYRSSYSLGGQIYRLVFVEKRDLFSDAYGDSYEAPSFEVIVLDQDGEIVLRLYDGVVERDDLAYLAALIEEHNDRTRSFFAAFDESVGA